jgi:hypothetical protein
MRERRPEQYSRKDPLSSRWARRETRRDPVKPEPLNAGMLLRFFASRWLRRADFKTVPLCASTTPDGGLLRPTEGSLSRDCRGTVYDLAIHASVKQIVITATITIQFGVDPPSADGPINTSIATLQRLQWEGMVGSQPDRHLTIQGLIVIGPPRLIFSRARQDHGLIFED